MRILRVVLFTALGVFVAIQLVPYGWWHENPPVVHDTPWPTAQAARVARVSCYDCHSNESEWPVYSYVAPMSWLVRNDVEEGRSELNFSEWPLDDKQLDDTLDVFPCHGVGGMVGMLMTGIFAKDVGLTSGHAWTFVVHCGALVFVAVFSFSGSWALYKLTNVIIPLRVSDEQEDMGLDLSQHGEVMQETVLGPIGMTASSFEQPQSAARTALTAAGHYTDRSPVRGRWHLYPEMAAAGLWTTPTDLARFAIELAYEVVFDPRGYETAMAKLPPGAVPVFVINHRSNADFVVLSYGLLRHVALSYAVGEWARVFPLEYVFKSFGSYFVRRRYREPLYHTVLERYVQLITRNGVTQGIFPEGGLTRDGRLRGAKIGLLDYALGVAREPGFAERLYVVPVAINYDRVLEDRSLLRELEASSGGRPPSRARECACRRPMLSSSIPAG